MIGELALGFNAYIDYETQKVSLVIALATGMLSFLECIYFTGLSYSFNLFLDISLISGLIYVFSKLGLKNYINIGDWWLFPAVSCILFSAAYGIISYSIAYGIYLIAYGFGVVKSTKSSFLPFLFVSTLILKVAAWQGFLQ